MFTPIDPAIREKVISAYVAGHGRNQITRELHEQGIKVSHGSISNFINAYKRKHEEQPKPDDDAGSGVPGSSPLLTRIGQAANDVTPKDVKEPIDLQEIDFDDTPVDPDVFTDEVDYDPEYDGVEGEHRFNYTNTMNPTFPNTIIPFPNTFNPYLNNFNQQVSLHVIEETKKEESDQTSTIDWDDDENHQARFVKWVLNQKKIRQQEERKLEEGWRLLVNERNSLEEQKRNLEAREAKLHEVKDLIPSAKVLKEIGFDFSQANSWLEAIKGKADQEGLDLRTAAWGLVEDLRNWTEVGGLRKAIAQQKQQLDLLCLATDQQKQAIGIIVDLKKSGMTDEDISNLVNFSKWSSKVGQGSSFELDTRLNLQNTPQ